MSGSATPDPAGAGGAGDDSLDEDMAAFFGRKESGVMKERVVKGMNLWDKKQATISGERIAKVDRVASQVAVRLLGRREPASFQASTGPSTASSFSCGPSVF